MLVIFEAVNELVVKILPYDVDNDDKLTDILNATVERPYDTIEDREDTPEFVAPAATVERPYEIMDDI